MKKISDPANWDFLLNMEKCLLETQSTVIEMLDAPTQLPQGEVTPILQSVASPVQGNENQGRPISEGVTFQHELKSTSQSLCNQHPTCHCPP